MWKIHVYTVIYAHFVEILWTVEVLFKLCDNRDGGAEELGGGGLVDAIVFSFYQI